MNSTGTILIATGDLVGHGNPNGVVTGNRGAHYYDLDSMKEYLKTSGDGTNTGWTLPVSGAGGSGGQIQKYVSDPNSEGVVPDDLSAPAVCYPTVAGAGPVYYYNTSSGLWE